MKKINKFNIMEVRSAITEYLYDNNVVAADDDIDLFAENLSSGYPEDPEDEKEVNGSAIVIVNRKQWIFCQFIDGRVKTMWKNFSTKKLAYLLEKYAYGNNKVTMPWCFHRTPFQVFDHVTIRGKKYASVIAKSWQRDTPDGIHTINAYTLTGI